MEIVGKLPEDCGRLIWRMVFDDVIKSIAEVKPCICWTKYKSDRLKILLRHEVGAYQPGYSDFDINSEYCINCALCRFPCYNCSRFLFSDKIEPAIFCYEYDYKKDDIYYYYNWEDPFDDEFIMDF